MMPSLVYPLLYEWLCYFSWFLRFFWCWLSRWWYWNICNDTAGNMSTTLGATHWSLLLKVQIQHAGNWHCVVWTCQTKMSLLRLALVVCNFVNSWILFAYLNDIESELKKIESQIFCLQKRKQKYDLREIGNSEISPRLVWSEQHYVSCTSVQLYWN